MKAFMPPLIARAYVDRLAQCTPRVRAALATMLAAGMLMTGVPATLPPASQAAQAPQPDASRVRCGGYDVVTDQPSEMSLSGSPARLRVVKNGRPVWTLPDAGAGSIASVTCRDATGDRIPDLLVERYSGGAHCCSILYIVALAPRIRVLLRYNAGNADGYELIDLNGDGRLELLLGDDSFAYFDDLCFACSPMMMLIACFEGSLFADCTRSFPARVREEIAQQTDRLRDAVKQGSTDAGLQYVRGAALGLDAAYALLGQEAKGWDAVRAVVSTPAVLTWLSKHRGEIRQWAASRMAKLRPGP
jgi:hypothetical protein